MIQTDATTAPETMVTKSRIPIRNLWYMLLYVWDAFRVKTAGLSRSRIRRVLTRPSDRSWPA